MLCNWDKIKILGVLKDVKPCTQQLHKSKQKPLMPLGVDHYSFNLKSLLPKCLLTFDAVRRLDHLGFYGSGHKLM